MINELTHMLENARSCLDLIFTSQTNMVIDSGVHASLHSNCHLPKLYTKVPFKDVLFGT